MTDDDTATDDALLASAFRKILGSTATYHYVYIGGYIGAEDERPHVTLDSTWDEDDGLTAAELAAMHRVESEEPSS